MNLKQRIALELARQIRNNTKKTHPLQQLFWECTLACNLECLHCGSDCKKTITQTPDMPFEHFLKAIDSITPHVNPNKVMIIMSGGEPLMRTDLEKCGLELYQRGFPWGLVTNGLALTPQRLKSLLAAGLHSITVSIDGLEPQHNWLRNNKNSFEKATQAIQLIAQTPQLAWDVVTCVNQQNINHLNQLAQYLYSIGVRSWRLFTIAPMGRAKQNEALQLSDADFKKLLHFIATIRQQGQINAAYSCEGFLGEYEGKVRDHLYQCAAGISVASVLIDGSISGCTSVRGKYYQGNIYKDDFWTVWENKFENYRNRNWMKKDECANCKMFRYCEGNGMHLRTQEGKLLVCQYKKLTST